MVNNLPADAGAATRKTASKAIRYVRLILFITVNFLLKYATVAKETIIFQAIVQFLLKIINKGMFLTKCCYLVDDFDSVTLQKLN